MEIQVLELLMNGEFAAYIALAFVLYALREASNLNNKYIPVVGLILGIGFAIFEMKNFEFNTILTGIQYALLAIGTVAGVKYFHKKGDE
jgi:Phage holin family Hol44, in holin superfamily V